jgi:hypothetical protein
VIGRLRRSLGNLASEQRRVALAAALVLVSLLLPWYSKSITGFDGKKVLAQHEAKLAIFVPSFVEASIFLVAVAILVLMFFRGERAAFHLPFGDGIVVSAGGAWVGFLVFYRFIDQPAGGKTDNLVYTYDLSWGIFFGLLAAAFLIYAGTRLRLARVAEPPLPGEGPTTVAPRPAAGEAPTTKAPVPAADAPTVSDRRAEREAERAEREARRRAQTEKTAVAPREPARPEIDGGTQLSFDEQE